MKDYLIIYHKEDNDGVVACAILCDYLNKQNLTYDIWGANYRETDDFGLGKTLVHGCSFEDLSKQYSNIMITDVSFNNEKYMQSLYEMFGHSHFFWVDHHEAIMTASRKKPYGDALGLRDANHSALYNMYSVLYGFMGACDIPEAIKLLSAFDSFSYQREGIPFSDCYDFNRGFTYTFNLNVDSVVEYIKTTNNWKKCNIKSIIYLGNILNQNEYQLGAKLINDNGEFGWTVDGTRRAVAVVASISTNSKMFGDLTDRAENVIVFKRGSDGNWKCSLYNTDENDKFDCGAYLKKKYKGGGHVGAGGAEFNLRKFNKMLKSKSL